jgi:hypothetical protein
MEPDLHKRHFFVIDRTKTNTPLYADDQDTIADSDDNLQKGVFTLQNTENKTVEWRYHRKIRDDGIFRRRPSKM